jgi:2-methylcitrate dehydratase PrpD
MTGLTGGIGAAAAVGTLLGLDEEHLVWALGIAAVQAAGFREAHATMCSGFVPAQAGRSGLVAALLAARGFTCSERSLEAPKGFSGVFAAPANLDAATDRLGQHFEMLANAYKPYPCGIVIHPAIDACLDLAGAPGFDAAAIAKVELRVHPLAIELTGRPEPRTGLDAQVSLYHWVAATLLQGAAGLAQGDDACVRDPAVIALRRRIVATGDPALGRDEAKACLVLADGSSRTTHIRHSRGSLDRPLTDRELDDKFRLQAVLAMPAARADALLALCRDAAALPQIGDAFTKFFEHPGIEKSSGRP